MTDYYEQQLTGDDPLNWIKAHPLMLSSVMEGYPFDHAGRGETSLLMALLPEGVDKTRISQDEWYSRSAREASIELGIKDGTAFSRTCAKRWASSGQTPRVPAIDLPQSARLGHGILR